MTIRTEPPPLDRLSALLDSALPRIDLVAADAPWPADAPALCLDLLTDGDAGLTGPAGNSRLAAPAVIVSRRGDSFRLALPPGSCVLRLRVTLDGPAGRLLAAEIPDPLAVRIAEVDTAFAQIVRLIGSEVRTPRCGHPALLRRAGDILFIGLLRHLIEHPEHGGQLFRGLADRRIARALVAIHGHPGFPWTLPTLADAAGMSRTAFANTFRERLQQTPGSYLTTLRLALARRLVDDGKGLKEAARVSGYGSAAALSRALSRSTARQD